MNIIGGGPVGLWTAKKSADLGIDATVHEEHLRIGKPEHCTGLLSNNIDRVLAPDVVLNYINGAKFFAGEETILERRKVAKVIERTEFDKQIYDEAVSSGVKVNRGSKVRWQQFKGNIVAADGAISRTRNDMGQNLGFLPALQFDVCETPKENFVELWFEPWNPDYFVWVVPRGNCMRVGTAARNLRPLKDFVLKRFGRFRPKATYSGLVVTSGPVKKTYFDMGERKVFLVGDSAGHVKPISGGGLVVGMSSAEKLARALFEEKPEAYERLWRNDFGRELRMQGFVRRLMMNNPEGFVKFLKRSKIKLETSGDMDRPAKMIPHLLLPAISWVFGSLKRRKIPLNR